MGFKAMKCPLPLFKGAVFLWLVVQKLMGMRDVNLELWHCCEAPN